MLYVDRTLRRRLRQAVRQTLKRDRRLWRQALRHRRLREIGDWGWLFVIWLNLILVGSLIGASRQNGPAGNEVPLLLAFTLYAFFAAFWLATSLSHKLWWSDQLLVWLHYPVKDSTIAAHAWRRSVHFGVFWFVTTSIPYFVWNSRRAHPWPIGVLVAFLVAQWVVMLAMALLVGRSRSSVRLVLGTIGLGVAVLVVASWDLLHKNAAILLLEKIILSCAAPFGTLNALLAIDLSPSTLAGVSGAVALGAWGALRRSHIALMRSYSLPRFERLWSPERVLAERLEPQGEDEWAIEDVLGDRALLNRDGLPAAGRAKLAFAEYVADRVREEVRGRNTPKAEFWKQPDVVVQFLRRRLTPRERTVIEFLAAGNPERLPTVSGALRGLLLATIVALAVLLLAMRGRPGKMTYGILAISIFFTLKRSLSEGWPGFLAYPMGLQCIPVYATFPISYRELSSILRKVRLARLLVRTPTLLLLTGLVCSLATGDAWKSLLITMKLFLMLLGLMPLLVVRRLSPASITDSWYLRDLIVALLIILPFLLLGAFGGCVLWFGQGPLSFLGALILWAAMKAYGRVHERRYNRGRVDLVVPCRRS